MTTTGADGVPRTAGDHGLFDHDHTVEPLAHYSDVAAAGAGRRGGIRRGHRDVDDRAACRRRDVEDRGRDGAVADVRGRELQRRRAAARREHRKVKRDAMVGIEPDADGADQARVVLRRHLDVVGRLAADVCRGGCRDVGMTREPVEPMLDLRDRRGRVRWHWSSRVRARARHALPRGQRPLVNGLGHRVGDPERPPVDDELRVAVVGLELEPQIAAARPQPAARPVQKRINRLDRAAREQVVREGDVRADSVDRPALRGEVQRRRQRNRGRYRSAADRGHRDGRGDDPGEHDAKRAGQQAPSRGGAQELDHQNQDTRQLAHRRDGCRPPLSPSRGREP